MGVLCLLNWGLTQHDAIIDAWPRRSIADFVGSGLRISPKRILQVQIEVLRNGQICNIPWFLESFVFSSHIPTLDPTFWMPSRNLPGNTQGCYPRGNACPSGSVQRFPDRWEVGHVTWTYDEKYLEISMTYLVLSRYLSLAFGRADLVDKILECSRDKFRMVMEVLNSKVGKTQGFCQEDQDIFTHFTTNSGLGDRHATNKWLFGHFMNGKIGLPRWTRLPWWPYRSYPPGIIPLSFCLAVRCWLEDVKIPLLCGISAAPQSVVFSAEFQKWSLQWIWSAYFRWHHWFFGMDEWTPFIESFSFSSTTVESVPGKNVETW